ncbi:HPF/RaiA family ribosome-associated protein [Undibacterium fentianense]|uniref:HPF/RaiA family ribosome-associated protein n=1 Tax=Undibacterium fentianense TaxID=2828728 RepID=A0A941IFB4_9BURK|nr:HPF/RaiA family ribosome-associated protein [Undibacterium fentianense]MBR7800536.1 HPF/RaiA family ribosome-associated protein [Undibacterium fentianense]
MQIDIQARGFELTDAIREHTLKSIRFATGWAGDDVRRITIRLSDINGPRGGEDKRCLIQIPLAGKQDIIIDDVEADLYVAIDKATQRAERMLAKHIERHREHLHHNWKKNEDATLNEQDEQERSLPS